MEIMCGGKFYNEALHAKRETNYVLRVKHFQVDLMNMECGCIRCSALTAVAGNVKTSPPVF